MEIPNNLKVILIAEDSPTQAESLRYFLERHGYQVLTAKNGREAVNLMTTSKPDLVISDIIMPEMDGYELCHFIRADPGLKDLPVIFLTVLSDPADIMKSLECGADSFIIKPFQGEPLIDRIRLLLTSRNLREREGKTEPVEVLFHGQKYLVNADRLQIMNLLVSTYEAAVEQNQQLIQAQKELKAQAQVLAGINRVFHEALTSETEEELGRICLAMAEELTGSQFGFIGELNEAGLLDDLAMSDPGWAACRMPGETKPTLPKALHIRGIFGKAIKDEHSVIANDPASHPDRVGTPAGHPPLTAFLGVPLKQGGRTIGMIGLGNKPGGYYRADQEAAEALAVATAESLMRKRAELAVRQAREELEHRVAARTVELSRTVEQLQWEITERQQAQEALRESEERLRFLTSQLLTAQETERGRLSRELHDDLGQALLVLKMQLNAILRRFTLEPEPRQNLEDAVIYLLEVIDKVRRLSRNLSPQTLKGLGLLEALEDLFKEFQKYDDQERIIKADLEEVRGILPEQANIIIYRITQEFLANVHKHSGATQVAVAIKTMPEKVTITLEDNGKGFDREKIKARPRELRGMGVASMEERLRMLGSQFDLTSQPGKGTRLYFEILRTLEDEFSDILKS